jgi:hypothetical protein
VVPYICAFGSDFAVDLDRSADAGRTRRTGELALLEFSLVGAAHAPHVLDACHSQDRTIFDINGEESGLASQFIFPQREKPTCC